MNAEEDFGSDSDQSDDDFCPDVDNSEPGSEEESEDISADEANGEEDTKLRNKKTARKRGKRTQAKGKSKNSSDQDSDEDKNIPEQRRQTRQAEESNGNSNGKAVKEKDEIETDDEDKTRSDALWADFLSDVKQPTSVKKPQQNIVNSTSSSKLPTAAVNGNQHKVDKVKENPAPETKKVIVTEVVDFAGEAVSIQKSVPAESIKENTVLPRKATMSPLMAAQKRPASGVAGGIGSFLNQIGKKKKISVLEKSKLDWNTFKQKEGIEEELQTHNKGKDGYLERQDFLQRTDLRQFEIEKSLRQTRRNQ